MAVNTYSDLKTAIGNRLDEDVSSYVDDWIDLGEDRIARDVQTEGMETALSVTIASGVAAIPSDFLSLKTAFIDGTPVTNLNPRPLDWLLMNYPTRSSSGKPRYIARNGSNWEFGPYPDSTYTVLGTYYKRLAALSTSNESGWLVTDAPNLIFYAALIEAADHYVDPDRRTAWEARYNEEVRRVKRAERANRYGDQPMWTKLQ